LSANTLNAAHPRPLDWVVFKIVQHCNLNCSYCYVYNRGDNSWKSRPRKVSDEVVLQLALRIDEQCRKYALKRFNVEFHGGEPLLIGIRRMERIVTILKENVSTPVTFHLQTNGTLLNADWIKMFHEHGISFGLSMDGPPQLADRYRVYKDGTGSTADLVENIVELQAMPEYDHVAGGVLCVISDPYFPPGDLLQWFVERGIKRVDFLLPDGNYVNPPQNWSGCSPYTNFLREAFREWLKMGPAAPKVRLFEYMVFGMFGEKVGLDALGGSLESLCVIESDGSIGVSDVARICAPLSYDKLDIFSNRLDSHAKNYDLGTLQELSETCQNCRYLSACGGGYLPHRFDGDSFQNPSLYCEALFELAREIEVTVRDAVSK